MGGGKWPQHQTEQVLYTAANKVRLGRERERETAQRKQAHLWNKACLIQAFSSHYGGHCQLKIIPPEEIKLQPGIKHNAKVN